MLCWQINDDGDDDEMCLAAQNRQKFIKPLF